MARKMQWLDTRVAVNIPSGDDDISVLIAGDPATPQLTKGMTLTRLVGDLSFTAATLAVILGAMEIVVGIAISSDEAIAVGGTSVAFPANTTEHPPMGWMLRTSRVVTTTTQAGAAQLVTHIHFDLKVQRKLQYGEPFIRVQNLFLTGTAFTVQMSGLIRGLYRLA